MAGDTGSGASRADRGAGGLSQRLSPAARSTRVGPVTLLVPQTREGAFSTEIFKRYQRSEQAFVLALMEMVVQGVSTRKVSAITEELCGASFSKSTVSALCCGAGRTRAGVQRAAAGRRHPPVRSGRCAVRQSREGDRVVSRAALVVSGIPQRRLSRDSRREDRRHRASPPGTRLSRWLKGRGLQGVMFVVSDSHGGLTLSYGQALPGGELAALPGASDAQPAGTRTGESPC